MKLERWRGAWLAWLVAFLAVEIPAAMKKTPGFTLSENVWSWFGVRERRTHARIRRVALGVFMLTLSSHFVFAWPGAIGIAVAAVPVAFVIAFSSVRE